MKKFKANEYYQFTLDITKILCEIPAPSGLEDQRAMFIKDVLHSIGYIDAYIDSAKNVIWKIDGKTKDYTLFMAHTDTVFPDLKAFSCLDDGEIIRCPGVCDDTVCLAIILAYSKYLKDVGFKANNSIMFCANSCEEGLGNLKGVRQIFNDFANKIKVMFTLDGDYSHIVNKSVGSHRYKITAKTIGGHSFNAFGRESAIAVLARIVDRIYQIDVPKKEGTKTTYNVGLINGGTSVNTIAQQADMLCEYRSDDNDLLLEMKNRFNSIFKQTKSEYPNTEILIELVGDRPAMANFDRTKLNEYSQMAVDVQHKFSGLDIKIASGSTDCNIPHSLGVPAVCVGVYEGGGVHTREEWLVKKSVETGLNIMHGLFEKLK